MSTNNNPFIDVGPLTISPDGRVWIDDEAVALAKKERDVMSYLAAHREEVVPREDLLRNVWNAPRPRQVVVDETISKIRRKLNGRRTNAGRYITTVLRRGVRLTDRIVLTPTRRTL